MQWCPSECGCVCYGVRSDRGLPPASFHQYLGAPRCEEYFAANGRSGGVSQSTLFRARVPGADCFARRRPVLGQSRRTDHQAGYFGPIGCAVSGLRCWGRGGLGSRRSVSFFTTA